MTEYGRFGLRRKIIAIICDEWPTREQPLEGAAIYDRLQSEGVEFSDRAVRDILIQLASRGDITLVLSSPPSPGLTIHDADPSICLQR